MSDLRQQHGNHTWDIIINYVACPFCQFIIENRQKYKLVHGHYEMSFVCPHCKQAFIDTRKRIAAQETSAYTY